MSEFAAVPVPTWSGREQAASTLRQVDAWLASEPLRALIAAFGGDPADSEGLPDFAQRTWDFRGGNERDMAARHSFSPHIDDLVASTTAALGLRDAVPPRRDSYDAILILGGLLRGCLVRPRYAAMLLAGDVTATEVTALGSTRPLGPRELELAARLGVTATDEAEALAVGMHRAFGDRSRGRVIVAPPRRPGAARANTRETFQFWAEQSRDGIRSVLLVTHPIYVPYQSCVAIGTLGLEYGLSVETVGVSAEAADLGADTGTFGTQEYLQETLSAITAMTELRTRL